MVQKTRCIHVIRLIFLDINNNKRSRERKAVYVLTELQLNILSTSMSVTAM